MCKLHEAIVETGSWDPKRLGRGVYVDESSPIKKKVMEMQSVMKAKKETRGMSYGEKMALIKSDSTKVRFSTSEEESESENESEIVSEEISKGRSNHSRTEKRSESPQEGEEEKGGDEKNEKERGGKEEMKEARGGEEVADEARLEEIKQKKARGTSFRVVKKKSKVMRKRMVKETRRETVKVKEKVIKKKKIVVKKRVDMEGRTWRRKGSYISVEGRESPVSGLGLPRRSSDVGGILGELKEVRVERVQKRLLEWSSCRCVSPLP